MQQQPAFTPEQMRQLAEARRLGSKVRRAMRVATLSGWTISIFAGLTVLFSLFDPAGLILGLGMGAVGWMEFQGAARLRRLDDTAAGALARNQIILGVLLLAYAAWGLYHALGAPLMAMDPALAGAPEVAAMMRPYENLARVISLVVYVTLALVAVFGQGGAAWYYASRGKYIRQYAEGTPAWIVQLQRAGMSI